MNTIKSKIIALIAMLAMAAGAAVAAPGTSNEQSLDKQKIEKIRKELVTLPYYGVFDNLAYKVEGNTVTLYGQVVRPSTRKDAAQRVAHIPGVAQVVNNIEVLPLSSFDDSVRVQTYRAVFRAGSLYRYAMGANPSLHIIVKNGHVTLEGVVGNNGDRQLAYIAANGVPGVFSVTNHLRTDREAKGAY